jgi:hypothetical protein
MALMTFHGTDTFDVREGSGPHASTAVPVDIVVR